MTLNCRFVKTKESSILLCADTELLGKKITENGLEIEFKASTYGEKTSKEKLSKMLKDADNINLFGKESTAIAVKEKIAKAQDIKKILGVAHLQVYRFR